eukprot:CAMPEP_0117469478 /NCGR_PEP_ID=MMETSP0784-20121206/6712_1 /TAXON_ID=39447 /ORGANISM="" /LENGTH=288 /DNA_ID=CAMNT_0005263519 /DNA_START=173 /DNA_END=1036 /DNA_ORIENTATION=-
MRLNNVYLKVSAEAHGFMNLVFLGVGALARWGVGMEHKLNMYRKYVMTNACECDIVLLVDAGDVMVLGSASEVEQRFLVMEAKWRRSVFFGAEATCSQWEIPVCDKLEAITAGKGTWRFLNSGLLAGRGRALQRMFEDTIKQPIKHDQEWCRLYFVDHLEEVGIDYDADLFVVAFSVEGLFSGEWSVEEGQPAGTIAWTEAEGDLPAGVVSPKTNTRPIVLHFAGPGKWQRWWPPDRSTSMASPTKGVGDSFFHVLQGHVQSCAIHEVFLRLFPAHAAALGMVEEKSW